MIAAAEAGCDAVDGAMDAMSGLTSQPNLGSIVEALRGSAVDPQLDRAALQALLGLLGGGAASLRWPSRATCAPAPPASILHGMPGGQYTNLREQARSLGLEKHWPEVEAGLCRGQ